MFLKVNKRLPSAVHTSIYDAVVPFFLLASQCLVSLLFEAKGLVSRWAIWSSWLEHKENPWQSWAGPPFDVVTEQIFLDSNVVPRFGYRSKGWQMMVACNDFAVVIFTSSSLSSSQVSTRSSWHQNAISNGSLKARRPGYFHSLPMDNDIFRQSIISRPVSSAQRITANFILRDFGSGVSSRAHMIKA